MTSTKIDSKPEKVKAVIRRVAGDGQAINFDSRLDEIFKFHQKTPSKCLDILEKLENGFKQEFGRSMKLDGGKRPAGIVMYYEK